MSISYIPVYKHRWNGVSSFHLLSLVIFPRLSALANLKRKKKITMKMQFVMWFAGLRGAIPFALAFNMPQSGPMWNREVIVTTTLSVCLITTLVLGGLTEPLLKRMNLSSGNSNSSVESTAAEVGSDDEGNEYDYSFLPRDESASGQGLAGKTYTPGGIHSYWKRVDEKLMKVFSNRKEAVTAPLPPALANRSELMEMNISVSTLAS